jgi:hypothetical protein
VIELQLTTDARAAERLLAEAPGRLRLAILRGLKRSSEVVVKQAKSLLNINRSSVSGLLSNSIWYVLDEQKLTSTIGPGLQPKASVTGNPRNYGRFVERGRKPGGFPDARILDWWIRKKLGKNPAGPVDRGPAAGTGTLRVAIANKIRRRGFPGRPYLEPALVNNVPAVVAAFDGEIRREIEALNRRRR